VGEKRLVHLVVESFLSFLPYYMHTRTTTFTIQWPGPVLPSPEEMTESTKKRKAEPDERQEGRNAKAKGRRNWDVSRKAVENRVIQPGDAGIWATCAMNKEAKSVADLRDLFGEYAAKLYPSGAISQGAEEDASDADGGDIEDDIKKEIADLRNPASKPLFTSIKLDTQCLIFFRTRKPLEPVSFVHRICNDVTDGAQLRNLRYVKRLTPITAYDKATQQGLETVAKLVLAPHFHAPEQGSKKVGSALPRPDCIALS